MKRIWAFVATLLLACGICASPALAETGAASSEGGSGQISLMASAKGATNKTLIKGGTTFSSKTFSSYDITGDGVADTIRFDVTAHDSYWASSMHIYVNGSLARTVTDCGWGENRFYRSSVLVKYMRLKSGRPFLLVKCNENNGDGSHHILQYRGGKLVSVASPSVIKKSYGSHIALEDAKASGNAINVKYSLVNYTAGVMNMTFTYKVKGGTLKMASSLSTKVAYYVYANGKTSGGTRYCAARKSFKVYSSTKLSKVKFTVAKGQKVKISRACIKSGNLYFKVTAKSGKSGWIRALKKGVGTYGYDTLLNGTFLAG